MEQPSRPSESSEQIQILEGQLRECYGRVVYSHKTHEKCADILLARHSRIKLMQIALSAITTGGFIAAVIEANKIAAVVGAILSTILLALNAYTKDYDLGAIAQKHRQAGADLWQIRERYLSLIADLRIGASSIPEVQTARDTLLVSLHGVYSGAPSTTFEAYRKAQNALKKLEDLTFSDAEIDAFLPRELKRKL